MITMFVIVTLVAMVTFANMVTVVGDVDEKVVLREIGDKL